MLVKTGTYNYVKNLYSQLRIPKPASTDPKLKLDVWAARAAEPPTAPRNNRPNPELIWKAVAPAVKEYEKRVALDRSSTVSTKFAMQRLMRDWREVNEQPLPTVSAAPVFENDFLEWHANMYVAATLCAGFALALRWLCAGFACAANSTQLHSKTDGNLRLFLLCLLVCCLF